MAPLETYALEVPYLKREPVAVETDTMRKSRFTEDRLRMSAQATRAILLPNATTTSGLGVPANARASDEAAGAPRRALHRTADTAMLMSRRLSLRWSVLEVGRYRASLSDLVGARYERRSILVPPTSPGAEWNRIVPDPAPTPAVVVDRAAVGESSQWIEF